LIETVHNLSAVYVATRIACSEDLIQQAAKL